MKKLMMLVAAVTLLAPSFSFAADADADARAGEEKTKPAKATKGKKPKAGEVKHPEEKAK